MRRAFLARAIAPAARARALRAPAAVRALSSDERTRAFSAEPLYEPPPPPLTAPVPVPAAWEPVNLPDLDAYRAMYKRSVEDPDGFWGEIAREFHWEKAWTGPVVRSNFKRSEGKIETAWFEGGVTNLCYNALDRHVAAGHGDQVCFIAERNDDDGDGGAAPPPSAAPRAPQPSQYTYAQALDEVKRVAAALRARGVGKGDRVALFMPMVRERARSARAREKRESARVVARRAVAERSFALRRGARAWRRAAAPRCPSCRSRCSRARASARCTPSSSAASAPRRSRCGSRSRARKRSSRATA